MDNCSMMHNSVIWRYELTDEKIQLVKGRRLPFSRESNNVHDNRYHSAHALEGLGHIRPRKFGEAFDSSFYCIQGNYRRDGYLSLFLAIPDVSEPWLFIAPDDITVDAITDAVARSIHVDEVESEAKKLILVFEGKPVSSATLESLVARPLDVVQVVEERAVTVTLQIHEGWQTETTHELSVPTTATSSDIVKLLCQSEESVEFDENKYTPYISAGFSCFGEFDFPGIDVIDRKGRYVHEKKNTTNFVLHQAPKDEKLECIKVRMLKNDEWVDSVILLPQTSSVGDLRCELGKMLSRPGNSLSIGLGTTDNITSLPQNTPLAEMLNNLKRSKKDTSIVFVESEAEVSVTVAVESPKKVKMFKRLHFRAQKYDPAAVVYKDVAEKMKCDPGLVRLCHQGKVLSDFALLCQCLRDHQGDCSLTAVILKEGTTLRLLHKTGLCCKILVEDTTKSTVADMERLVEDIHSYSRGSVTVLKEGLPLDRGLTISEAGLRMQDAVLVTTCDQANAVTGVPLPFQCVFEAGQDGETHQRFAVRVNGIPCYVPDGVGEAELAGQREEDPVCLEPVSGIHVLSRIRHGAPHSSSHGTTPKSCRHATEYYRRTSAEGASNTEKEAASRAECAKATCLSPAAKTTKPTGKENTTKREPIQRSTRGREQGTPLSEVEGNIPPKDDSAARKRDRRRGFISDLRDEDRTESEHRSNAGFGIPDLRDEASAVSEQRSNAGCGQELAIQQFYQGQMEGHQQPRLRFQSMQTCEVMGQCSSEQLQRVLEQFSPASTPRRMREICDSALSGPLKEKDDLDNAIEEIAEELGHNWSTVCQSLGLAEKDIHVIEARHPLNLPRQAQAGLTRWKQAKGKNATMSALISCLRSRGRADLADKLCEDEKDDSTEKTKNDGT